MNPSIASLSVCTNVAKSGVYRMRHHESHGRLGVGMKREIPKNHSDQSDASLLSDLASIVRDVRVRSPTRAGASSF